MTRAGFKMKQARLIREAYERGELSWEERNAWLDEIRRPDPGFWERLMRG